MTAEEQIVAWARKEFSDPAITRVEFVHHDEYHYSEVTMEAAYDAVKAFYESKKPREYTLYDMDPLALVKAVLEANA